MCKKIHLPPGGRGYVGTRGVVPSVGLEVTGTGLTVTRTVSFSPTRVLKNGKINFERVRAESCLYR